MNVGTEKQRPVVSKRLARGIRELAPHYRRWANMKARCHGNSYHNKWYKDRGIKICEKWRADFWAFSDWCSKTYEEGKTLDRIDNNGDYSPENCKWSSQKEQMQNSRRRTKQKLQAVKVAFVASEKARTLKYGDPKARKTKHCKLCGKFKLLDLFYKNKNTLDGRGAHCKKCNTLNAKKYRNKNASDT